MGRFDGKVVAVTGGASGIGEATARLFAEDGAKVAIADLDAERGRSVAEEIKATGAPTLFVETRTEREAEAARFIERARAEFGRIDVLVNNAGMRLPDRRRGERGELGRDPRRQPQGLRLLREGGDPGDASHGRREHRERRLHPVGGGRR